MSREGWLAPSVPAEANSASFAIGLMYAKVPTAFANAVAGLVRSCDWLALSRLSPHLANQGDETPSVVIEALVERIRREQTKRTAEPELFSLLARLSPDRLVREPWGDTSAWMPQARSEFADAVAKAQPSAPELQKLLLPFMGDGQYGVRRSAYRAMALVDAKALATICESWALAKAGEDAIELRQRAAEAAGWLPDRLRTPEVKALATDPDPTVRQAFARCDRERRERRWADRYVDLIEAVKDVNDIPPAWAYGRALGKIGDDHALERLDQLRRDESRHPAVRHWLSRVVKKVRSRWDDATRQWPDPWFARRGRLDEVDGVLVQDGGSEIPFRGWLWLVVQNEPTAVSSWGGWSTQNDLTIFEAALAAIGGDVSARTATLMINGRTPAEIIVTRVHASSGISSSKTTYFTGNGKYPAPTCP